MPIDYSTVKIVHQTAVALSLSGFFFRGWAALRGAHGVAGRAAKTLPHVVDTVLLLSALWLAWSLRATPGNAPWLTAKVIGLFVYVGLGVIALRPTRPLAVRAAAWFAALVTAGWIVSVALTKNPLGFLAALA
ncbi:SirB2 family protein [Piscinibacter sakaiensis]|uniref:SirB2 family protein n=1 Tax=Piscinibacter sakaiensis TaxID=1547922 RepID=UPI003AAEA155